jgi:hypothetical protein
MDTVVSWRDLAKLGANSRQTLALGIFPWSNFSRATKLALKSAESRFNANGISLAEFELGEPHEVLRVCPPFLRHFLFAVTEPACLLIRDSALVAVRFGRATAEEVLAFVLSNPTLPQIPNLSAHPHPELIGPSLTQALTDEDASVRKVADELLRELNWPGEAAPAKAARDNEPAHWWEFWKQG